MLLGPFLKACKYLIKIIIYIYGTSFWMVWCTSNFCRHGWMYFYIIEQVYLNRWSFWCCPRVENLKKLLTYLLLELKHNKPEVEYNPTISIHSPSFTLYHLLYIIHSPSSTFSIIQTPLLTLHHPFSIIHILHHPNSITHSPSSNLHHPFSIIHILHHPNSITHSPSSTVRIIHSPSSTVSSIIQTQLLTLHHPLYIIHSPSSTFSIIQTPGTHSPSSTFRSSNLHHSSDSPPTNHPNTIDLSKC